MAKETTLRFSESADPVFGLILQLRALKDFGDANILRQRIHGLLNEFENNARQEGHSAKAISSAKFALAALIDESILKSEEWSQQDQWLFNPLCMELFQRMDAGEVFFRQLDAILKTGTQQAGLLEVYYLCIALGFKGQYDFYGADKLSIIKDNTYRALQAAIGKASGQLSPNGYPKEELAEKVVDDIPVWKIAAALGGIAIIYWVIFYILGEKALG